MQHIRGNKFAPVLKKVMDELKPEAAYFTELDGTRGAVLIGEVSDPSKVPAMAEPFFLNFNADCRFRICTSPGDLSKAGVDELVERWG